MNIEQIKVVLADIQYPVEGEDMAEVLESLHYNYPAQVVGSTVRTLGDAEPLYLKAGQVAFLIDNEQDLATACVRIRANLKAQESEKPVIIQREKRSRHLNDIIRSLDHEIDTGAKFSRPMGIVDTDYRIKFDPETRTQTRKAEQIIDDLLSSDTKRNRKAVEALQCILIVEQ